MVASTVTARAGLARRRGRFFLFFFLSFVPQLSSQSSNSESRSREYHSRPQIVTRKYVPYLGKGRGITGGMTARMRVATNFTWIVRVCGGRDGNRRARIARQALFRLSLSFFSFFLFFLTLQLLSRCGAKTLQW